MNIPPLPLLQRTYKQYCCKCFARMISGTIRRKKALCSSCKYIYKFVSNIKIKIYKNRARNELINHSTFDPDVMSIIEQYL